MAEKRRKVKEDKPGPCCCVCGAALSEKKFKRGKAVEVEGDSYCVKCLLKTFSPDCVHHTGVRAKHICAMCKMPLCTDCVVKIGGLILCWHCHSGAESWTKKDISEEEFVPPGIEPKREKELFDRLAIMPHQWLMHLISLLLLSGIFAIGIILEPVIVILEKDNGLAIMIVLIVPFAFLWLVFGPYSQLQSVNISDYGIDFERFNDFGQKTSTIPFNRVNLVEFALKRKHRRFIRIKAGWKSIFIRDRFQKFNEIAAMISAICLEKNLKSRDI